MNAGFDKKYQSRAATGSDQAAGAAQQAFNSERKRANGGEHASYRRL